MSDKLKKRIEDLNKTHKDINFTGIKCPSYTLVPDVVVDELMPILRDNEFKILLCIVRQTFGFNRDSADISIKQMIKSTGLSRQQVLSALRTLKELNIIKTKTSTVKEFEAGNYSLNLERWS